LSKYLLIRRCKTNFIATALARSEQICFLQPSLIPEVGIQVKANRAV
jgi:hypothetical protein